MLDAMESAEPLHQVPSLPDVLWVVAASVMTGLLALAVYWLW
jgi:hypothetical protein